MSCYRRAIGTLLSSVQRDRCPKRRASVKRRIAHYIEKAEELVQRRDASRVATPRCTTWNYLELLTSISRYISAFHPPPIRIDSLSCSPSRSVPPGHLGLVGDRADLGRYRVTGVLADKVLLARDDRTGPVVLKAVLKSPPVSRSSAGVAGGRTTTTTTTTTRRVGRGRRSLLPVGVPNMVR